MSSLHQLILNLLSMSKKTSANLGQMSEKMKHMSSRNKMRHNQHQQLSSSGQLNFHKKLIWPLLYYPSYKKQIHMPQKWQSCASCQMCQWPKSEKKGQLGPSDEVQSAWRLWLRVSYLPMIRVISPEPLIIASSQYSPHQKLISKTIKYLLLTI